MTAVTLDGHSWRVTGWRLPIVGGTVWRGGRLALESLPWHSITHDDDDLIRIWVIHRLKIVWRIRVVHCHDAFMKNTTSAPVRLRAGSPAQLVATLPYLFGFRPDQSVIVLGLRGRRIDAAARLDASVVLDDGFDAVVLRNRLSTVIGQGRQVIAVAWHDDAGAARRAVDAVVDAIGAADMAIIVSGGRCQADDGPWQDCPDGVAEADDAGLTVLASRAMIEASVAGPSSDDSAAAAAWMSICEVVDDMTLYERRGKAKHIMEEGWTAPGNLTLEQCLELAALARQGRVRDVMTAPLNAETARSHLELWGAVVPRVPDGGAPAVLGLLGLAAWLAGEGALQVCCLERGLALEPDHSLLRLVETINVMGVHPREWAKVRLLR